MSIGKNIEERRSHSMLLHLMAFFSLFPYLNFLGLGTDTQPNALIIAAIVLFTVRKKRITSAIVVLWTQVLFASLLFFMNSLELFIFVKTFMNYLSPPMLGTAFYVAFSQLHYRLSFKFFLAAILFYAFVGIVQLYWYPDFMLFIVNESRGLLFGGRGVLSLCPEPSFYGSMSIFFIIFSLLAYTKKQNLFVIPFQLVQILLLSKSSTAIAILGFALIIFSVIQIIKLRIRYIIVASLALAIAIPVVTQQLEKLEESRMGKVAQHFIDDPLKITQVDGSVGIRFAGTVAPFINMRYNNFMPMGLGRFEIFQADLYGKGRCRSFLNRAIIHHETRISGGINMALFQLGFLGLFLPIGIFLAFKKSMGTDTGLFAYILFTTILFTQIQMMHAMIGLIIGFAIFHGNQLRVKKYSKTLE